MPPAQLLFCGALLYSLCVSSPQEIGPFGCLVPLAKGNGSHVSCDCSRASLWWYCLPGETQATKTSLRYPPLLQSLHLALN